MIPFSPNSPGPTELQFVLYDVKCPSRGYLLLCARLFKSVELLYLDVSGGLWPESSC